jgi:3-polyprenyl-4-hydroxybenzoate decarboxylase
VRLIKALRDAEVPTHLIVSKSAAVTLKEEAGLKVKGGRSRDRHLRQWRRTRRGAGAELCAH